MIGLLLDDQSFEQDIRELLMAFYPGEGFVHEESPGEAYRLLVRGRKWKDAFELTIQDFENEITKSSSTEADFSDRFDTKNRIKRMLYGMVQELTGMALPWGTLTGIRPTKIAMTKLSLGYTEDEVRKYMKNTYLTSDGKIDLSLEIAGREMELLSSIDYHRGYSLYIGIPFCPTTCLYCSFTSFPIGQWEKRMEQYLEALFKEMDDTAEKMAGRTLDTVYIGGGTPTSLSSLHLEMLISRLKTTFDFTRVKEFTVEAGRPDSITLEKLQVLKSHGVTRISINPQTMKQETLDLIGRRHTVDMVKDRFHMARSLGFDNINMDLIIGLPEEDMEDVVRTMEEIQALGPDGITVHSLAIKRAARLNMFKDKYGDLKITNTEEMIGLTASYARNMGQEPYYLYRQKNMAGNFENVGYSLPGKACIYNILIMEEKQTIAACGAGTTTKVVFPSENRLERVENVKDVEQYIARIDEMLARKEKMLANLEM
ncbi:coproporphyrinogen dehydrogenase HemZ [Lacrimispora saccharolytica]|uniref:Coproporphyrinogen dehydrogenase n=1 Tax=Lacrimispora saccharolytica (strain ATCC 35040 / DSM 2544 / NRCC 2533 / WM1) TaxID=610130 RepID=D9RAS0_LACSW|nr:coproporphyrinogen dehydrogenase HemZ [Lacrimispora saccharolytica]ADL06117.1 Coproporphyrinogen dehydrogenase [[Clostridium] saccharolyticum WM1]QRV19768.1 coproporphyrinogen dehydrogenase HemZ [Lacrimispora saccharolytica]